MANVDIVDIKGNKVGTYKMDNPVLKEGNDEALLIEVIKCKLANHRAGTHKTKGRSEISGGGAKPWRQKGTGRARAGSIRSPIWRGGGTVFGPTPRDYSYNVPKKKIKKAKAIALMNKVNEGSLIIVDDIKFEKPSAKSAVEFLNNIGCERKSLVIVDRDDINTILSFRNLRNVIMLPTDMISAYDILNCEKMIVPQSLMDDVKRTCAQ
ncbi:MAG: 50S ribosomal protein L4 [Actinobacteria bacterium]|nr:50S ribosomal protein L4 [Actinomycetota bacterium]